MSYQVLARKWRPRNFEQMVGQPHVLRALVNALNEGRLHHAYLFTGTRGVGKTTVARILAKCLNCETGVTAEPCGQCSACREIDEGRFVDLIEVDAASRTKVEDTRELLDNVQYAPTRGRYKVYLIDEVHMLSGHSFNALLKTLEEPPPHVKFLLATTDPQKLPVTVLSRCLQFNLKRMPADMIAGHLARILAQEGIAHDARALALVARAADGSMRDALSLLDQAIAFGGGELRESEVRDMLGGISQEHLFDVLEAVARGDGQEMLAAVGRLAEQAPDYGAALGELISILHQLALAQVIPGASSGEDIESDRIADLAGRLAPEDVQLFYQIALLGRRDLPFASEPRSGFEMVLLRMLAFRPAGGDGSTPEHTRARAAGSVPATTEASGSKSARRQAVEAAPAATTPAVASPPDPAPAALADRPGPAGDADSPALRGPAAALPEWSLLIERLGLRAMTKALASNCVLEAVGADEVRLVLAQQHEDLRTDNTVDRLREALSRYLGRELRVKIRIGEPQAETPAAAASRGARERQVSAEAAIADDRVVLALRDTFGAELVPGSVKPL